jgi:hypothetical protein
MNHVLLLIVVAFCAIYHTFACVSGSCKNGMCSDIPSDNTYYLTSFCDSSVACGSFSGNCNEYYAADYSRFGCNSVSKFYYCNFFCSLNLSWVLSRV